MSDTQENQPKPYSIPKRNFDKLFKKAETVRKKCEAQGKDFRFEIVGEETRRELIDAKDRYGNYIVIDLPCFLVRVEGIAKIDGWTIAGSIEHTEAGNIIRKSPVFDGEIPEFFQNTESVCEHCKGRRDRKKTTILINDDGRFMQIGKSCLQNYLGIDASAITSMMEIIRKGGAQGEFQHIDAIPTDVALRFAAECVRKMGFVKSTFENNTAKNVWDFAHIDSAKGKYLEGLKERMAEINFSPRDPEVFKMVDEAMEWLNNSDDNGNYISNLRVITSLGWIERKHLNILVSIFAAHDVAKEWAEKKRIEAEARAEAWQEQVEASAHIGNIGKRITFTPAESKVVTSWENQYGMSFLNKITDTDGNIFIWKSSNKVGGSATKITGTVKEHTEFRGLKQTVITRCRVEYPE